VKNFNRYKAKVSHVTETCNRKAHQMDINVKRNLLTKYHKDERNVLFFFLKSKLTEFVKWLSQALIHEKLIHREIPIRVPPPPTGSKVTHALSWLPLTVACKIASSIFLSNWTPDNHVIWIMVMVLIQTYSSRRFFKLENTSAGSITIWLWSRFLKMK